MSKALSLSQRHCIVSLLNQSVSKIEISRLTNIPYNSVLTICKLYTLHGDSGLSPQYAHCGRHSTEAMVRFKRICLWLKRRHPSWGAPIIRVVLTRRYGVEGLPSIRQMQKWFRLSGLNKPRQKKGQPSIGHALAEHNIWQVDVKERFTLASGQAANYLNIVDEYSGAWLEAPLFPLCPYQSSSQ